MKLKIILIVYLACSAVINSSAQCQLIISYTPESCFNCCDGSATAQIIGSSGNCSPYSIYWNTTPVQVFMTAGNLCAGTYTAYFSDGGGPGCCDTISNTITIPPFPTNVINHTSAEIKFEISPNPASSELKLTFGKEANFNLTFCNISGKVLKQVQTNSPVVLFSVVNYPQGIYFITVTDEYKNSVTRKVAKMY